tara:strand:+ start:1832 stop:2398 length:567 start_codon:yes stop_codon:yes gene_type:complete
MLISDSKEFIFFHLYKTAGTSLTHLLQPYTTPHASKHPKVVDYLKNGGRETYEKYFTFGFVRNPWDWQVSLYHYMLMDTQHFQHKLVSSFKTYEEYLDWRVHEDCKPQYTFFSENADEESPLTLDFVGRFEKLSEDVDFLKSKLGIVGDLPHFVKSNHAPYKEYYNETTQKMIADAYHKDVSYFNYTF